MIYEFVISMKDVKMRVDAFLRSQLPDFSREKIKKQILAGKLLIDRETVIDPSQKTKSGQKLQLEIEPEPKELKPQPLDLEVLYEDADFLAINKPAGLVVHPGANISEGTLVNALVARNPEIAGVGHQFRPGLIHRLDKDTSGVLLIAKNEQALAYGKEAFQSRNVTKEYTALVYKGVNEKHGFIEKSLLLDPKHRRVVVSPEGKSAKTEFRVRGYYQDKESLDFYTLVDVILHTGRTHQIRVHFASLGHPVAGDEAYGKNVPKPSGLTRQFLHAKRLMFKLPNGTVLELVAPLPQDLQVVLDSLVKV